MRKLSRVGFIAVSAVAATLPSQLFADADISVQSPAAAMQATANVDLVVNVPDILTFGVGDVGAAVAELTWNTVGGVGNGNDQTYNATGAPASSEQVSISNGGVGSTAVTNVATLPVFLYSNKGTNVTIAAAVLGADGTSDALDHTTLTDTIPMTDFALGQTGANITHPTSASSTVVSPVSGIVDLTDAWTYEYNHNASRVSGSYLARITYTATTP